MRKMVCLVLGLSAAMVQHVAAQSLPAEPAPAACAAGQLPYPYPEPYPQPPPQPMGCELPAPPLPPCATCAPGQVAPTPMPPPTAPSPPPPPDPAPEQSPTALTDEDLDVLGRWPVSESKQILASLTAVTFGFGLGHAYQDRWDGEGQFFTLTETLSAAAVLTGAFLSVDLDPDRSALGDKLLLYGGISWAVLHAWGAIDVMTYNARLRWKLDKVSRKLRASAAHRVSPYLMPAQAGSGATAGFSLGF